MLKEATLLALANPIQKLPRMGAVLLTKDKNWHGGMNSYKTHPLAKKFGRNDKSICLHAEIDAIVSCIRKGDDPEGGTLFVARVLKNGKAALAKPCEGCQKAIIHFGIKDVEWTTDAA